MSVFEILDFNEKQTTANVVTAIILSFVLTSTALTFAFFVRDLIIDLLRRFDHYDIENKPEDVSFTRALLTHLIVMAIIILSSIFIYLFIRWYFILKYKKINK